MESTLLKLRVVEWSGGQVTVQILEQDERFIGAAHNRIRSFDYPTFAAYTFLRGRDKSRDEEIMFINGLQYHLDRITDWANNWPGFAVQASEPKVGDMVEVRVSDDKEWKKRILAFIVSPKYKNRYWVETEGDEQTLVWYRSMRPLTPSRRVEMTVEDHPQGGKVYAWKEVVE